MLEEADPAVVNLSQFEVFFNERRPLFVEGVDIFDDGSTQQTTIASAAKVSGKIGAWSVGLLDAVTLDVFNGYDVGRELGEVFRSPVENVFLIKATHWCGL